MPYILKSKREDSGHTEIMVEQSVDDGKHVIREQ